MQRQKETSRASWSIFVVVLLILQAIACSDDDVLKGFDKNALFQEPTPKELNDVLTDWQSRNLAATEYAEFLKETHNS